MVKHMKIDEDTASKVYDRWINRFEPDGALSPEFIDQVLAFEFGKVSPDMAGKAFDFLGGQEASAAQRYGTGPAAYLDRHASRRP